MHNLFKIVSTAEMASQNFNVTQIAADILCEFLEVAFHSILYIRQIYPSGIFQRRKKYNVPVQVSCHPELNQYITSLIRSIKPLMEKRQVYRVVLVILDGQQRTVERFVFEIAPPETSAIGDDSYLLRMEQSLRAFLLKLNICDSILNSNPIDCTWTVNVHTNDSAVLDLQRNELFEDFTWIQAEEKQLSVKDSNIVPLNVMNSGLLKMQLYVEECKNKHT